MKVAVFSSKSYDRQFLETTNQNYQHELTFFEVRLNLETVSLATGFQAVCVFVNDQLDKQVIQQLVEQGVQLIALRSAGYNNVDINTAKLSNITVVRVPAYSPHAVAEHAVGLMLDLNRKIHRAYNRVREGNFALEGLLGFDMNNKTVGIVGTGQIGLTVAQILRGFNCHILAFDPYPNLEQGKILDIQYSPLSMIYQQSDIISLHCPLTSQTRHLIDKNTIQEMKPGVMLINTSRGAVIDTVAVIEGLKSGQIGSLGLDVYEEEGDLFFEDLSSQVIRDDTFSRLLTFPNVIITGHQAFFTQEALTAIAETTLSNISEFEQTQTCSNAIQ